MKPICNEIAVLKEENKKLHNIIEQIRQEIEEDITCESQECGCDDYGVCLECFKNTILKIIKSKEEEKPKDAECRLCEAERIHKEELKALEKKKNKRITFLKQMVKKLNHEKACAWGMLVPIPYSYYDVHLWGEKAFGKEYVEKVRKAENNC